MAKAIHGDAGYDRKVHPTSISLIGFSLNLVRSRLAVLDRTRRPGLVRTGRPRSQELLQLRLLGPGGALGGVSEFDAEGVEFEADGVGLGEVLGFFGGGAVGDSGFDEFLIDG